MQQPKIVALSYDFLNYVDWGFADLSYPGY